LLRLDGAIGDLNIADAARRGLATWKRFNPISKTASYATGRRWSVPPCTLEVAVIQMPGTPTVVALTALKTVRDLPEVELADARIWIAATARQVSIR